ncbi:MAG: hypothetical protein DRP71_11920 [Verrucomicrobia bacterium]|nr:MAG: hypothetical protein DRP71_11920 [Verrucomicrobiota bacterium]
MFLIPLQSSGDDMRTIENGVAQLFVDDQMIASSEDLVRTLHEPVKDDGGDKPVIEVSTLFGEEPATLEANGTIIFDPMLKRYVMYALAFAPAMDSQDPDKWQRTHLLRYTSPDGLTWIEGDDGIRDQVYPRSREDLFDPKSGKYATYIDLCSFIYDASDAVHPYKAWIWFANWEDGREGIYLMSSADGKQWNRGEQILVHKGLTLHQEGREMVGPGDVTTVYREPGADRFLALIKFYQSENDKDTNNHFRSRAYLFIDEMDKPIDLSRIKEIDLIPSGSPRNGDDLYDEYYGASAWRYGSQWLGLLKVWHGRGDTLYSAAGCAYFKLVTSRDGLNWEKVAFQNTSGHPEVFLANGEEGGNQGRNDGGYMTDFSQGPLRFGDELIYYYGASSYGKDHPPGVRVTGGGIFRARLRIDGFVSVDGGTLTTPELGFGGSELYINSTGQIKVEVLDSEGTLLGSTGVEGNDIRGQVRFDGESIRRLSGGRPTRLRFSVEKGSELYSFTIE